jgi:plasmid stabilization system protein ParE
MGRGESFHGTRPLRGLIVANLLLNNWDFGVDQNRIYRVKNGEVPEIRYVVQDVGGSLGKSTWIWGTRNDIDDFESQGFVKTGAGWARRLRLSLASSPDGERHPGRGRRVGLPLLDRLSERQLREAVSRADYAPDVAQRYVEKIRAKIREGLALRAESARSHQQWHKTALSRDWRPAILRDRHQVHLCAAPR